MEKSNAYWDPILENASYMEQMERNAIIDSGNVKWNPILENASAITHLEQINTPNSTLMQLG